MSPKLYRMEVVNNGSGLVIPRGNTATHPWQAPGRPVADESMQIEVPDTNYGYVAPTIPFSLLMSTIKGSFKADSNILPQELQRVHAEFTAATAPNSACWRQRGRHALNYRQTAFVNAARQYEQEAHDRTEVAVAEATARTQADMLREVSGLSTLLTTVSNQQMEVLNQMILVAQNAKEVC